MAKFLGYPPPSKLFALGITCAGLALVLAVLGLFHLANNYQTATIWAFGALLALITLPLWYFMVWVVKRESRHASAKFLLNRALDSVSNGVLITDARHPDHPVFSLNPAFSRLTKYEPHSLLGRSARMLEGPETDKQAIQVLNRALKEGRACRITTYFYRRTGEGFCGDLTLTPIRDTWGHTAYHVWELVDLTEREKTWQAQYPSQTLLAGILDSVPEGLIVIDSKGRIEVVNSEIERTFGFTENELHGENVTILMPPPDRHRHDGFLSQYLRTGESKILETPREVTGRRKDGGLVTVELTVRPIKVQGETKFIGIVRGKPEQNQATLQYSIPLKVALAIAQCDSPKEAAETVLTICGNCLKLDRGAVWTLDPTTNTLEALTSWSSPILTLEEPLATSPPRLQTDFPEQVWQSGEVKWEESPGQSGLPDMVPSQVNANAPGRIGLPMKTRGQTLGVLEFQGVRLTTPDSSLAEILSAVGCQIAEFLARMQIQEAHERVQRQLRKTQKTEALGSLAGGIAHDFNNTLTAILGFSELAFPSIPAANKARAHLQQVIKAGSRAKDLVQQLLTFSRQEEQGHRPIQIQDVLQETINMLRSTIPSTIQICSSLSKYSGTVLGDPAQLQQVLVNLCTNAEYAMREAGGVLEVTLNEKRPTPEDASAHPSLHAGPYLLLTVRDSGSGMSETVKRRMFEPFFSTKPAGEGTGMGLAVVQGIVTAHGGAILVESQPYQGTTVEVYFPIHHSQEANQVFPTGPVVGGEERILFVDDDGAIASLGGEMLESLGYTVVVRNSALDALKAFRTAPQQFDAVITDQIMPHMTGETLAAEIHTISPTTPIILLTGATRKGPTGQESMKEIGAYLNKPITKRDLALCLREILDNDDKKEHEAMYYPYASTAQGVEPCAPSRT